MTPGVDSSLLVHLAPELLLLCSSTSSFTFHSFNLLLTWTNRLNTAAHQVG